MQYKTCKGTISNKGCGETKPVDEFKAARTNKNTGVTYRKSICRDCENRANRVNKSMRGIKYGVITPEIFKQYEELMRMI